jgi:hypothetical protein
MPFIFLWWNGSNAYLAGGSPYIFLPEIETVRRQDHLSVKSLKHIPELLSESLVSEPSIEQFFPGAPRELGL